MLIDSFNDMLAQIDSRDSTLANYRDQLERQVGVRTAQLEKAKDAAEAASQAKSAFLATISHENQASVTRVGIFMRTSTHLCAMFWKRKKRYHAPNVTVVLQRLKLVRRTKRRNYAYFSDRGHLFQSDRGR